MKRAWAAFGRYCEGLGWSITSVGWAVLGLPEWTENWKSWPHCNGQGQCWMHYGQDLMLRQDGHLHAGWCRCRCLWCLLARHIIRRSLFVEAHCMRLVDSPKMDARSMFSAQCSCGYQSAPNTSHAATKAWRDHYYAKRGSK